MWMNCSGSVVDLPERTAFEGKLEAASLLNLIAALSTTMDGDVKGYGGSYPPPRGCVQIEVEADTAILSVFGIVEGKLNVEMYAFLLTF